MLRASQLILFAKLRRVVVVLLIVLAANLCSGQAATTLGIKEAQSGAHASHTDHCFPVAH